MTSSSRSARAHPGRWQAALAVAALALAVGEASRAAEPPLLAQATERAPERRVAPAARPSNDGTTAAQPAPSASRTVPAAESSFQILLDRGDIADGRDAFAAELARAATPAERASLSLAYGNALATAVRRDDRPAALEEAKGYLRYAFEHGSGREAIVARNNYASIALQQERIDEALAVLEQGYETARRVDDRAARARYLFNYARLVERYADGEAARLALGLYREAYRADPQRPQPAEAGVELALRNGDLPAAATFLRQLVAGGHPAAAAPYLRRLTGEPELAEKPGFAAIVEVFFDFLPAAWVEPKAFEESWRAPLERLAGHLTREAAQRLDLVFLAYAREPPSGFDPNFAFDSYEMRSRFAPWFDTPEDSRRAAEALARPSRFLAALGEIHEGLGALERALSLYALAWALNTANLDAGLYAANLLLEYPARLDPDGWRLQRFVDNLFAGKTEAYLGEDLPNILRFHTILGTIFARQRQWGDSSTRNSAIFQLENALRIRNRLAELGRAEEAAVPGLHAKLAEAYAATGDRSRAFDRYLIAAREALAIGNLELARRVLFKDIEALGFSPGSEGRERLDRLRSRLE